MEITNHRMGERCVLTFKLRGWRGKDANKVKGSVFDQKGNLAWELAGKWTPQLIARRAGYATGELAPSQLYLQLWKNEEQPGNILFNLTTFAINLNNINNKQKVWLPPTDCRLRPDQHMFERGSWEKAIKLKGALEDYQRLTRWKRETGEWLKIVYNEDTGEKTWDVIREQEELDESKIGRVVYWEERKRVGLRKKSSKVDTQWDRVDHIFGEFELI
ncbi:Oxysterol-binding protein-domain-containing protein [Phakopsora pachyrhizi]|nr:Oxysterol-binding protein-domain-containing protein [Phakopsora pachyrhizi]